MKELPDLLDLLSQDNYALTIQLLERVSTIHKTPRLRGPLSRMRQNHGAHLLSNIERERKYLVSALGFLVGREIEHFREDSPDGEITHYLRCCDSYGLAVQDFLAGSAKAWADMRPKYQELVRTRGAEALREVFAKIKAPLASNLAADLCMRDLLRMLPAFPFHRAQSAAPLLLLRPQRDVGWTLVKGTALNCLDTLCTHFPDIDWINGSCERRRIWLLGIRFLSALTPRISGVMENVLAELDYHATFKVIGRRRLLTLAFVSEADVKLFKFNLAHYSKLSGAYLQFVEVQLSDFRQGHPGISGLFADGKVQ